MSADMRSGVRWSPKDCDKPDMRKQMAVEMLRVVKPTGLILWYDYHVNNPGTKMFVA